MLMRWISALGGLIILFGSLFVAGAPGLAVLGSLIVLIAAIEFGLLFEGKSLWLLLFLVFDIAVYATQVYKPEATSTLISLSFVTLSALSIILYRRNEPQFILSKLQWTLWGVLYTALFPAMTVHILLTRGWVPVIYLLVVVFFGDVLAFFCGRYIGGPKIFPNVSPKKTISGAIGGLTASALCGALFLNFMSAHSSVLPSLFMSFTIGFFAQFGDFFESLIKRVSGCKDSGQLMPGHGGFLDRLDGVYFGSVIFYVFCTTLDYISYF